MTQRSGAADGRRYSEMERETIEFSEALAEIVSSPKILEEPNALALILPRSNYRFEDLKINVTDPQIREREEDLVSFWCSLFKEEIETVKLAGRSLKLEVELSDDSVQEAWEVGHTLISLLIKRLNSEFSK